jgi:hypothetical protein
MIATTLAATDYGFIIYVFTAFLCLKLIIINLVIQPGIDNNISTVKSFHFKASSTNLWFILPYNKWTLFLLVSYTRTQ